MTNFEKGTAYLFRSRRSWVVRAGAEGGARERKLIFLGNLPAAAPNGLKVFRSATAGWKETFTQEQLGDFRIEVAS